MNVSQRVALLAASVVISVAAAGCTAESTDAILSADESAVTATQMSEFQRIVERKGNIFNVFCSDAVTGENRWRIRAFFQPDLYPDASIDFTSVMDGFPFDPANRSITVDPTDAPEFFAVRNASGATATAIVFEKTADGMVGTGQLRGTAGSWKCQVWAKRYLPAEDRYSAWARAL
jgi:hypothetical protein